ncbi:trypco2 family protein [Streptomyces sp. NPDC006632]|uniref:trypco2 family protein n=1 Tax=Streptomyces sp. NPDC006632 TaxID=3157182 RepID=UPI0033A9BBC0
MTDDSHAWDGIELADAIESVRDQLTEAAARATGQPLVFELGDIQMEFTLELRKEVKGGAKVRAWVVDAGADAARITGRTHKVSFTLKPHTAPNGSAWKVGNDRPGGRFGAGPR